jgi:hypothetical protein
MSREQELRQKWEPQARTSYADLIGQGGGGGGGGGVGGGGDSGSGRTSPKWQTGVFPNVPDRFRLGSKHNTIFNNNLFYAARIDSENARIGVPEKHAKKPPIFDSKSPPPQTGREREHKSLRYGADEGFAQVKRNHARQQADAETQARTRERLEQLEGMLHQAQQQRRELDKKFDAVLDHIIDGVKPAAARRQRLSLQEQIDKRKEARRRDAQSRS